MKSIKTAFILLIAVNMFSSCQKEFNYTDSPSGLPPGSLSNSASFKVKTYTEDVTFLTEHTVTTYNVSYDGSDKITSLISTSSPGDKFIYQYTNNSFTVDIHNSNQLSVHSVYFINNLALVDSSIQYNETQDTMTEKYLYNADKKLVELKQFNFSTETGAVLTDIHTYLYDNNGNVLKDSTSNTVLTYDYYNNLLDNLSMDEAYSHKNKNLIKTTTYRQGGTTETVNHTYTFDNYNRLTSEKVVASTGHISIKSYTY